MSVHLVHLHFELRSSDFQPSAPVLLGVPCHVPDGRLGREAQLAGHADDAGLVDKADLHPAERDQGTLHPEDGAGALGAGAADHSVRQERFPGVVDGHPEPLRLDRDAGVDLVARLDAVDFHPIASSLIATTRHSSSAAVTSAALASPAVALSVGVRTMLIPATLECHVPRCLNTPTTT